MAAVIARDDLAPLPDSSIGHYTHEKSPLGAAAALATLDVIAEEDMLVRARTLGERGLKQLDAIAQRHAVFREARGVGLYFGLEVEGPEAGRGAEHMLYECLGRGLSFKVGGGSVITRCPPRTIAEHELDRAFDILEEAAAAIAGR
jgi:4-aminobutyrate aminotransferase